MKWCVGPLHQKSPLPPPPPPNFGALGAYGESQGYYSSALSLHYRIYHGQNIEKKYTEIFQGGKKLEGWPQRADIGDRGPNRKTNTKRKRNTKEKK